MSVEEPVEIVTGSDEPQGSVIWLHGLGADGHDFEPIVPDLWSPAAPGLRFVFPHAPMRPVTINGGMTMRAWFDILSLDRDGLVDEAGVRASIGMLEDLIQREQDRGIDASKIVVAGFSQGGAIAIHAALRSKRALAGLMALSTYLPLASSLEDQSVKLPVFMAHGTFDPVLPMGLGRESADCLIALGFDVEWHEYPMAHAVCAEEIDDIRRWLLSVFAIE